MLLYPEDVCVDNKGMLYTATRDGWIKRMHSNGSWENWKKFNTDTLLGLTITAANDLIVCDCIEVVYVLETCEYMTMIYYHLG